jgi:hypothetical protein
LLHEFRKGHGFINAGDAGRELRHERLQTRVVLACNSFHGTLHFLHVVIGINFHGAEVIKAVNGGWFATNLLAKGVTEIVGRVSRYNQDLLVGGGFSFSE